LPDIAIVDLGLPDEDGLSLIRRWRSSDVSLPVLVLTAREGWQIGRAHGDWVSIMIPNANADHKLLQPKRVRLHVIGILQLSGQLDHSFA
ncbi:hypothetical protein MJI47_26290, partial [Salmonella enterica subsp. enterica serovar Kentucky]|nr:hypothetical protein [Salmonella enterica subsp. enterica serovar Kentucky]